MSVDARDMLSDLPWPRCTRFPILDGNLDHNATGEMDAQMHKYLVGCVATVVLLLANPSAAQTATFRHIAPVTGQRTQQRLRLNTNVVTSFQQSGQVISNESKNYVTTQVRDLVVLELADGRAVRASVTYTAADRRDQSGLLRRAKPQPVAGKTYHVARPNEDAELVITYPDGSKPSPDELAIVDANMQAVGKSNPLVTFLSGKSVSVGERLVMPRELAADLLGATVAQEADNVVLTLTRLRQLDGQAVAEFATQMSATDEQGAATFAAEGQLLVAIASCRTLQLNMNAQIAATEERGPEGFTFQVKNEGSLGVEMASTYN